LKNILLLLFFPLITLAQGPYSLSEQAEISVLTIGPGDYLYDKFGHSAFRVKDPARQLDLVYNYGVYDFDTPNFYGKFVKGKLDYKLAVSYYESFLASYMRQRRWIRQQTLELNYGQKQALFNFLQQNAKPENQYYRYDFLFDNCATRIRDVLAGVLGEQLEYTKDLSDEGLSFRQLIQKNVYWNSWGSLGMDVAIGAVTDVPASSWEYQFLPAYVEEATEGALLKGNGTTRPLVKEQLKIYDGKERTISGAFLGSPLFVFGLLGILILYLTWRDLKRQSRNMLLDASIFFATGLVGTILFFLWTATDHTATANNYNLLWAFPFNLFFAGLVFRQRPPAWIHRYVVFLTLLFVLLLFHWITGVQSFAYGFIPLFLALVIRYFYVSGYLRRQKATAP
jgi:hypothetical protein